MHRENGTTRASRKCVAARVLIAGPLSVVSLSALMVAQSALAAGPTVGKSGYVTTIDWGDGHSSTFASGDNAKGAVSGQSVNHPSITGTISLVNANGKQSSIAMTTPTGGVGSAPPGLFDFGFDIDFMGSTWQPLEIDEDGDYVDPWADIGGDSGSGDDGSDDDSGSDSGGQGNNPNAPGNGNSGGGGCTHQTPWLCKGAHPL